MGAPDSLQFLNRGFTEEQRASLIDYLEEYRERNTLLTITIDNLRRQFADLFKDLRVDEDGPDAFERLRTAHITIDDLIIRAQTAVRKWHLGDPLPEP